jgi:hypothetical protein
MLESQRSLFKRSRYSQFGLQLWLDGTAVDNFEVDPVTSKCFLAKDRSQFQRNFEQATSANQPTYVLAAINSLPALRFDGVNNFMTFVDPTLSWLANTSFSFFYVATKTAKTGSSFVIGGQGVATRSNLAFGYTIPTSSRAVFGNDDINAIVPAVTPGQPELYTIRYDNTNNRREVRRNGVTVALGASDGAPSNMTGQSIGRYLSTYGQFDLGEILIYNRAVSDYEMGQVERDLISKWTIV